MSITDKGYQSYRKENEKKKMKRKRRIGKGIMTAVLACMLGTAFFSVNAEAATPEVTYDPNATKTGYHLEIYSQFPCEHTPEKDTKTLTCEQNGLNRSAAEIQGAIQASPGLPYSIRFETSQPIGKSADKVGNVLCVGTVPGSGLAGGILSAPYTCSDGYAAYAYYRQYYSHCRYTDVNYFTGSQHYWLGCARGDIGTNEYHPISYTHVLTRYRFVPNNYTVAYNGNGATTGSMANQSVTYDQTFNLTANAYQKDGYRFAGWNTSPDGTGQSFSNGQAVSNLTAMDGGVVTLYAQWTPITYTVHFEGNGATAGNTPNQNYTFNAGGYLNANGFKKQYGINYDGNGGTGAKEKDTADAAFNGWQDNNIMYYRGMYFNYFGFDAPYYVNKYPDIKRIWGYNKYATLEHWYTNVIAYGTENRQSAQNFKIDDYMRYGGSDLKAAFGTNRLAYVSHWMNRGIYEGRTGAAMVDTGTSDLYPNRAWVANLATRQGETVTLTADWTPGSVTLPTATRPGYQFAGWYTSAQGGTFVGNAGAKYTPTVNGGTLYAHWTANDYQIAFDGNGATSGSMENQTAKYDVPVTLNPNRFERTGYTFTGWNTSPDGTGTSFADRQEVKNLTTEKDGIVTLYAQWKTNSYTIHFDGNGATDGAMEDVPAVYDQDIMLPPNLFVRTTEQGESVFRGWNRDSAVYETEFADQETIRNLTPEDGAVVTLYAIWDDCPQIEAVDRYFSLDFAQQGKITEEELLSTASATDREDVTLVNRTSGQIAESGINGSLSLYGYAATDFTELTDSASVSMTYKAVDSIGNTVYKTVTVYITNTEPLAQIDFCYTRFINEKYFHADYENGGLHPASVWRNNPEYESTLENALTNLKNETAIEQYRIKDKTVSKET